MLKLSHIKKGYNKKDVLTDVSYTFEEGSVYSVLGNAGAGRTTLFECICGDVPVDDGEIETPPRVKIFYASKQSVLPVYITGYEFISMLCDMSDDDIEPGGINSVKDNRIIIISSGILEVASRISDDTIVLNNGEFNHIDKETMAIPEIRKAVLDILGEADNEIV